MTTENNHDNIALYEVLQELQRIRAHHGPLASTHEGLGVLLEEFEELKDEIKKRPSSFRSDLMRREAIQVAAVAVRIAADLAHDDTQLRPRTVLLRDQAEVQCDRMRNRALQAEQDIELLRQVAEDLLVALADPEDGDDADDEARTEAAVVAAENLAQALGLVDDDEEEEVAP